MSCSPTSAPVAVALLILAGCGGGGTSGPATQPAPPAPAATPVSANVVHAIAPASTDPAIATAFANHVAIAPGNQRSALLVVFLPGTSGTPACCMRFYGVAADAGAHVIGLMYPDDLAILQDCADDPACYGPIRLQKFDGVSRSPIDPVAPADSIRNRLSKLLVFLAAQYPGEGWGAFVSGGAPVWPSIVIAGHSQGAGEAALIGKVVPVARVVQLSGTVDAVNTAQATPAPATWVTLPGVTPASSYFGFDHTLDQFYAKIVVDWAALGQDAFGPHAAVDASSPPYGGSHELVTSLNVSDPHVSTVGDGITPLDASGTPIFAPVWRYLLGL